MEQPQSVLTGFSGHSSYLCSFGRKGKCWCQSLGYYASSRTAQRGGPLLAGTVFSAFLLYCAHGKHIWNRFSHFTCASMLQFIMHRIVPARFWTRRTEQRLMGTFQCLARNLCIVIQVWLYTVAERSWWSCHISWFSIVPTWHDSHSGLCIWMPYMMHGSIRKDPSNLKNQTRICMTTCILLSDTYV